MQKVVNFAIFIDISHFSWVIMLEIVKKELILRILQQKAAVFTIFCIFQQKQVNMPDLVII